MAPKAVEYYGVSHCPVGYNGKHYKFSCKLNGSKKREVTGVLLSDQWFETPLEAAEAYDKFAARVGRKAFNFPGDYPEVSGRKQARPSRPNRSSEEVAASRARNASCKAKYRGVQLQKNGLWVAIYQGKEGWWSSQGKDTAVGAAEAYDDHVISLRKVNVNFPERYPAMKQLVAVKRQVHKAGARARRPRRSSEEVAASRARNASCKAKYRGVQLQKNGLWVAIYQGKEGWWSSQGKDTAVGAAEAYDDHVISLRKVNVNFPERYPAMKQLVAVKRQVHKAGAKTKKKTAGTGRARG